MGILDELNEQSDVVKAAVAEKAATIDAAIADFRSETKAKAESVFTTIGKKLGSGNKQAWAIAGGVVAFLVLVVVVAALQ